jgi:RNA polymerase sigma-70 factor (ECF subfamily)
VVLRERTDADLLKLTRRDGSAFAHFYERYERGVLGYFLRRVRDPELAADLTAETFAAALGAAENYRPAGSTAAPWLFTIAHNTLARSLRRRQVEDQARRRLGMSDAIALDAGQLELDSVIGDQWVAELLDRLPRDQRAAVHARILAQLSYSEIADRLATSELVIRKRVSRGLAALRQETEDLP